MRLLCLSFFNDIWINKYPEFLILRELKKNDQNVSIDYLSCNSILKNICSCFTNKQVDALDSEVKKKKICKSCISSSNFYSRNIKSNHLKIDDYISKDDKIKIEKILHDTHLNNFLELNVDEIEVGKITLFNFLVDNKLLSEKFDEKHWNKFKKSLENSLIVLFGIKKILKNNFYNAVTVFSAEYSYNKICVEYAKKYNIRIINSAIGKNPLNSNKYWNSYEASYEGNYYHCNKFWKMHKNNGISKKEISLSKDWINSFLASSSYLNFSTGPKSIDVRDLFKIPNKYKKIVLVALSSTDERLGDSLLKYKQSDKKICKSVVFENDVEWTKYLIKELKIFENTFFIFRPHPRDFGSNQSKNSSPLKSDALDYYYSISKSLPENCIFNFDMKISIYDFIPEIDLLLNSSSTTSYEFGLFGIPTVIYDENLYYYSNDLVFYPRNNQKYIELIKDVLNLEVDKREIVINSFKWISMQVAHEPIDISDVFDINSINLKFKILNRIQRYIGFNFLNNLFFLNKNKKMKKSNIINEVVSNNASSVLEINLINKPRLNQSKIDQFNLIKNCLEEILSKKEDYSKLLNKLRSL